MNACTWRSCGMCGACTAGGYEDEPDVPEPNSCDHCGQTLAQGRITVQGVGVACSEACMTALTEKHAQQLQRRSA